MKTTKKQFKRFKQSVCYWQNKLNLNNYRLEVFLSKLDADRNAQCVPDTQYHAAAIYLSNDISDKDVERMAKHEVIHLFLDQLSWLGRNHKSEDEIIRTDEMMTVLLTKIL